MEKLIIFADYGLDDAAATAHIFKNQKLFKEITIVPIGGNVPTDISYRNCITLLNELEVKGITIVDTRKEKQPFEYLDDIHGKDGMGDIFDINGNTDNYNIVEFSKWRGTLSGKETILSLGPMTLVEPIIKRYQNKLIIMGGHINEKPNYKGYEFNHGLDPKAFAECVKHPHFCATLDTCSEDVLNMHSYNITDDDLYSRTLNASKKLSKSRNESGCYVYDDIAACFLIHPERFKAKVQKDPFGNEITNLIYTFTKPQYQD